MLMRFWNMVKERGWHRTSVAAIGSVLGFRGITAGTAFLTGVLVARQLQPAMYGQFAKLFALMMVVTGLAGPPLDMSLVRFAARHITPEKDESGPYFKLMFFVKCGVAVLILILGFVLAKPLVYLLFERGGGTQASGVPPVPAYAVPVAFLGGCAMTLWGFSQSYLQSHQRFTRYASYEFLNALVRIIVVVTLIVVGMKAVFPMLCGYAAAPLAMVVIGWTQLPRAFLREKIPPGTARRFYHFSRWVALAGIFTTLSQRVDILLLGYFGVAADAQGYYGAAIVLALMGDLVVLTFFHVILPKASQVKTVEDMYAFLRTFRWPALLFVGAMLPVIVLSGLVTQLTFGEAYTETGKLFALLFVGTVITLPCVPAITAIYGLGRSHIVATWEGVRLLGTFCIGILVVPKWGVVGMALTVSAMRGSTVIAQYIAARLELHHLWKQEGREGTFARTATPGEDE